VAHNTELNVLVQGNDNHAALGDWFNELWDEAQDFDETLMNELKHSWAVMPATPYDIYMKTLYNLVKDRLEGTEENPLLFEDEITRQLADFQKTAFKQAIQIIRDYGGVFVADVVGLGKSYIGAAIIKHFRRTEHVRPLIICPAAIREMWDGDRERGVPGYNQTYDLGAQVLSLGLLDAQHDILNQALYKDCDFVLIDESHNLRHTDTQRYKLVERFMAMGKKCCLLTATPRNKSAWDVYSQLKLFHPEDKTELPIAPPDIKQYFKMIEKGERQLKDLLSHIMIRRTRKHILRWYGYDADTHIKVDASAFKDYLSGLKRAYIIVNGQHQFFPKRELETVEYSIEATYQGLYAELRGYIGKRRDMHSSPPPGELSYARYGLWHFVHKEKRNQQPYNDLQRAGINLRGLMRILLFKRFESSVYAFRESVRRQITIHELFLAALNQGFVPAGEKAEDILYEPNSEEEQDVLDALRQASGRYAAIDFDIKRLKIHIEHDLELFRIIQRKVAPITPDKDAKLQKLLKIMNEKPLSMGKSLIFTQYADTARYLYDNLNPGGKKPEIEVIYSGGRNKMRVVGRFAPRANPSFRMASGEKETKCLIATDVLAEGLNMQDCDKIVNYDLHWNPVRLIQRFGRIDRIGSEHDLIFAFNFLPETGLEHQLDLKGKLHNRIQEIHDTIGEDAPILDDSERLNEEAMYAIYEKNGGQLSLFEEDGESLDLNEAEEMIRHLKRENPAEFERIAGLRDGIRSMKAAAEAGQYVMCQAGNYRKLYLLDESGDAVSNEPSRILGRLRCGPELAPLPLPPGYNRRVTTVVRVFADEVRHRQAAKDFSASLSQGQKYVMRELRALYASLDEPEPKEKITLLEKAFRQGLPPMLARELNKARRNGVSGEALVKFLTELYLQYNMKDWGAMLPCAQDFEVPHIVCSEGLTA